MSSLKHLSLRAWFAVNAFVSSATVALAQNGGTLGGTPDIPGTPATTDIRSTITNLLKSVLNYMALFAVIFIVIAGIRLIVSQGEDEAKEKAKKTIIYVVVGLIVILFARVIVEFVANIGTNNGTFQ